MASIHPTVTTPQATTGGNLHVLPPSPPAPPAAGPGGESPRDKLWTVQETLHLLYLLTLSRNDDPIITPEQWSGCLYLLSTQLEEAIEDVGEEPVVH
jgi:hypothetical protein